MAENFGGSARDKIEDLLTLSGGELIRRLEVLACGTPVLAAVVVAIPDVIKDGETGFILEDNSPECIARVITWALNHPNMEQIAANARVLVEREFTFEAAVERWRKILTEVHWKRKEFKKQEV